MRKLIGTILVVTAVILLINPVALGKALNDFGSCLVIGLVGVGAFLIRFG